MSIKNQLIDEVSTQIEELGKMSLGSDEYNSTVDGITKLTDRIIKIEASEREAEDKQLESSISNELKMQQLKEDKKDRIIRYCIEGGKIVGGFALTAWAFVASMNFEREGTLTTEGGRNALRSLLRFMR